ncbi:MAG: histidinol dehydrogenase, partial [Acidimicrobiales bacterium]
MLRRIDLRGRLVADVEIPRPTVAGDPPTAAVQAIIAEVRAGGDEAVWRLTERFDKVTVGDLRISAEACAAARDALPAELRDAVELARANIEAYHQTQVHPPTRHERGGVLVRELPRPVDRAGCYIPGGQAPLLSTVLMTAVPARVAGVAEVIVCTPPPVAPAILAAAAIAGVDEVYQVGGAQAIAAMAYGTESIRAVDVIVGPGNVYVSVAKREVAGIVGVPSSFAGPSEVVVVADETAPPEYAAVDLMVQVEHGPDSVAWLIVWNTDVADRVVDAVDKLLADAPRREVIAANLEANSFVALVDGPDAAIALANLIA